MFLNNKYSKWYFSIIETAKHDTKNIYKESHHIIPKCMGGTETVLLTAKEHFICHLLLTKMTTGINKRNMYFALKLMAEASNPNQQRYTSRTFEYFRPKIAQYFSEMNKGRKSHRKGVEFSETHKKNLSYSANKPHRVATAIKNLEFAGITSHSEETKRKISKSLTGRTISVETKKKQSESKKGKKWVHIPGQLDTLKLIHADELQNYLDKGWSNKRAYSNGAKKITT